MTIKFTAAAGTFEFAEREDPAQWFNAGSAWSRYMRAHGFEPADPNDPFVWSTDINGLDGWRRLLPSLGLPPKGDHADWVAGGKSLKWRQRHFAYEDRGVFAYSNAGQVAAYALADGLQIPWLVTIATPVRADMADVWRAARPNVGCWLALRASRLDPVMLLGSLGDGRLSIRRPQDHALADLNAGVATMRHGLVLSDPGHFDHWEDRGWLEMLRLHRRGTRSSSSSNARACATSS